MHVTSSQRIREAWTGWSTASRSIAKRAAQVRDRSIASACMRLKADRRASPRKFRDRCIVGPLPTILSKRTNESNAPAGSRFVTDRSRASCMRNEPGGKLLQADRQPTQVSRLKLE